jgi:type II secretory pathway predicted ATPase ExeA
MYESHWQLAARPFDHSADARFYYPGESQQGALLKLRYALENRRGAALLTGAAGLGKTLLAQTLTRQLGESISPKVHLVFPQMPSGQFLAYLADQLGAGGGPTLTIEQSLRRIETRLRENTKAGKHAVIVIDEAHLLDDSQVLETVRLLLNLEHEARPLASFLLTGQTSLLLAIERRPDLEERLAVKCLLRRFKPEETMGYIQHRLTAAGATGRAIFTDGALESIHQESLGIPRRINRLCDLALLVGFAEELTSIGPDQIAAISEELTGATAE